MIYHPDLCVCVCECGHLKGLGVQRDSTETLLLNIPGVETFTS